MTSLQALEIASPTNAVGSHSAGVSPPQTRQYLKLTEKHHVASKLKPCDYTSDDICDSTSGNFNKTNDEFEFWNRLDVLMGNIQRIAAVSVLQRRSDATASEDACVASQDVVNNNPVRLESTPAALRDNHLSELSELLVCSDDFSHVNETALFDTMPPTPSVADACVMTSDFEYNDSELESMTSSDVSSSLCDVSMAELTPDSKAYDVIESYLHSQVLHDDVTLDDDSFSDVSKMVLCSSNNDTLFECALSDVSDDDSVELDNNANMTSGEPLTPAVTCDLSDAGCQTPGEHLHARNMAPHLRKQLWCERCNTRLVELKRQAIKMWIPFASKRGRISYQVRTTVLVR